MRFALPVILTCNLKYIPKIKVMSANIVSFFKNDTKKNVQPMPKELGGK